jgi:signal transduction histidine kinase
VLRRVPARTVIGVVRVERLLSSRWAADLLLWAVIVTPVLFPGDRPDLAGLPLPVLRIPAVLLMALAVLVSRRMPVAAAAVPPALALAATPELYTGNYLIAQLVLSYLLGRRCAGLRPALLFFAAVCAAGLLLLLVRSDSDLGDVFALIANVVLTLVAPWLAGRYARQHDELVRTGFALAEKLEREQELAGDRARLRERTRIAQDMHDSLGHDLSLIALRAAALQVAPGIGPEGRQAAAELRQDLAAATERLRKVIGILREDGQGPPAADTVASLVERAAASGMAVALDDRLQPAPPMTDRAIYRVVQEALTNAAKHAPGAPVTVTLHREGPEAVVSVVNERPSRPPATAPGRSGERGLGLVGLDERIRQASGTLHARPVDGGFAVTARLPLTPSATATATPPARESVPQRELAQARRKVRRSMIDAIWVPAVAALVLVPLIFAHDRYSSNRTLLDGAVYQQLRIGELQPSVERRLPAEQIGRGRRPLHAPADPPGAHECRFYRSTVQSMAPAYRLCFTDGRLSHKDEVDLEN